jgi:hypothetical protein
MSQVISRSIRTHAYGIWSAVLIAGVVFQMGFLLREYILPWGWRAWQVRDEPRLIRSADMSLGAQAARIIRYVNQVVPSDATILLPPGQDEARFSIARSMQYFFFPRTLVECHAIEDPTCQQALRDPSIYVLADTDFPPARSLAGRTSVAPAQPLGWFTGIYGSMFLSPSPAGPFSLADWSGYLILDSGVVLAIGVLGLALLRAISAKWTLVEGMALAVPVGAGVLTWGLFILSWAGIPMGLPAALASYAAVLTPALWLIRRRGGWRFDWRSVPEDLRKGGVRLGGLLLVGAGMLALAIAISIGTSYRLYDPVQIWSVKGYGMAQAGTIQAGADWGVHGLAYPLNIPLQAALFFLIDGDALPGSKLLYPLYGLGLCLVVYAFLRRQGVETWFSGLGALFLASVPIMFFHASSGFANLPFTCYLLAGLLIGLDAARSGSRSSSVAAGLLLGLAAWTRPEGVLYAVATAAVLLLAGVREGGFGRRWPALLVPMALISGTWFAFSLGDRTMGGSNLQQAVSVFTGQFLSGHIELAGLVTIVKTFTYAMFVPYLAMFPAVSATYWGVLFPVVLVLMVWTGRRLIGYDRARTLGLAALWLVVGGINLGVFYIRSYSKPGFESFIERAFPRAFLPTAVLMLVIAVWGLGVMLARIGRPTASLNGSAGEMT